MLTGGPSTSSGQLLNQPSWLTMAIDGAFGSKTNVFTIVKPTQTSTTPSSSKKSSSMNSKHTPQQTTSTSVSPSDSSTIMVNQQACPAILKQILELLSTLARAANFNFFPRQPLAPTPLASKSTTATPTTSATTPSSASAKSQFWDIVAKLDQSKSGATLSSTKQKSVVPLTSQKSQESHHVLNELDTSANFGEQDLTIENSPLSRLMLMLDSPVLKNNPHLMDKMLTCLAYASSGIPQLDSTAAIIKSSNPSTSRPSGAIIPLAGYLIKLFKIFLSRFKF